jgi:hypothetical protein
MKLSNQTQVGLVTVICLLLQGYIFTYILRVEPNYLIPILPLIPYILYIYARGKRTWYFNKPLYWMAAVVVLTLIDLAPYIYWTMMK